ncbi:hypothetical protein M422DRAFT_26673 [Sphaerobolus stellatus SS14]|nr:hypothetical protein M422DRAFT_26673 [Sphaerobolus stellatus SS14]
MALHIITAAASQIPVGYYGPIALFILFLAAIRAFAQGRKTNRDRDLHARTVIITGGFTPLGLTILEHLAKKGAHIIALVPTESVTSHHDQILTLLRDTTSNESIYAEPCPLYSPSAIRTFCEKFVNTEDEKARRIDALILAHEYSHIGTWKAGIKNSSKLVELEKAARDQGALVTFLLITLLLPAMLVAPIDRDIRIINVVNPFYAAAAPHFDAGLPSSMSLPASKDKSKAPFYKSRSSWLLEGQRALRSAIFIRHLQRILDALPGAGQEPSVNSGKEKQQIPQKSNIMAVTVSPGLSRTDTVSSFLIPNESLEISALMRLLRTTFYVILSPLLFLLTKSPQAAMQTLLHTLCVPKPKTRGRVPLGEDAAQVPNRDQRPSSSAGAPPNTIRSAEDEEEVLVPGALYADCSIVRPRQSGVHRDTSAKHSASTEEYDLGLGDEPIGRKVWEVLEEGVKLWENSEKKQGRTGKET